MQLGVKTDSLVHVASKSTTMFAKIFGKRYFSVDKDKDGNKTVLIGYLWRGVFYITGIMKDEDYKKY